MIALAAGGAVAAFSFACVAIAGMSGDLTANRAILRGQARPGAGARDRPAAPPRSLR